MNTEIINEYQAAALRNRVSFTQLCGKAGVATSTITRWRAGMIPRVATLKKLDAAIAKLEGTPDADVS